MNRAPVSDAVRAAVAGCPHLATLPTAALESAMDSAWMRTLAADEAVFRAGDPGDAMFVVASGRIVARLSSAEGAAVDVAVAPAGTLFGYLELLGGGPRSVDAVALAPSRVVVFGATVAARLIGTCPALVLSLAQDMSGMIRTLQEGVRQQVFSSVPSRLARFLLESADPEGRVLFDGPQVLVAQRLGIARQALRRLAADGLVRVGPTGRTVTIVDQAGLRALASTATRHRRATDEPGQTTENPAGSAPRPVSAASTTGP